MTDKQVKYDAVVAEYEAMQKEFEELREKLSEKRELRNKLFDELNAQNYTDIIWMLNNPHAPSIYEHSRKWMEKNFGGDWNGVRIEGYRYNREKPEVGSQLGFTLSLQVHYPKDLDAKKELYKKNFFLFETLIVPHLSDGLRIEEEGKHYYPLDYKVEQHDGIFSLAHCKEDNLWYVTNTRYSRFKVISKGMSAEEAFEYAFDNSQEKEDEDDDC